MGKEHINASWYFHVVKKKWSELTMLSTDAHNLVIGYLFVNICKSPSARFRFIFASNIGGSVQLWSPLEYLDLDTPSEFILTEHE
jgi:hypothetical protein